MDLDFEDEFSVLRKCRRIYASILSREYEGEAQLGNTEAEEKKVLF